MIRTLVAALCLAVAATDLSAQDSTATPPRPKKVVRKRPAATPPGKMPMSPERAAMVADSIRRAAAQRATSPSAPRDVSVPQPAAPAAAQPVAPTIPAGAREVVPAVTPAETRSEPAAAPRPAGQADGAQAVPPAPEAMPAPTTPARTDVPAEPLATSRMPSASPSPTVRTPDEWPTRRPSRLAFRFSMGTLMPLTSLYAVNDGVNPEVTLSSTTVAGLELDLRLLGPVRLFGGVAGGRGEVSHSNVLNLTGRPARPSYATTVGVASGGLLLWPTFGRSVLQPFVRGGYGVMLYRIEFPGATRQAITPTLDAGGGFRLEAAGAAFTLEGRFLSSVFKASSLPVPLLTQTSTTQNQVVVQFGVHLSL